MRRIITITLILFCIGTCKKGGWSDYQGRMNWYDAKKKCESLGMRLPRIEELTTAYETKVTASWNSEWEKAKYSYVYWTSEESSGNYAKDFFLRDASVGNADKDVDALHVRCILQSEDKEEKAKAKDSKVTNMQKGYIGEDSPWINWEDAKKKCASLGRRLPTRDELHKVYETGAMEGMKNDGIPFWTSEERSADTAYHSGFCSGDDGCYMSKDHTMHVFCIR